MKQYKSKSRPSTLEELVTVALDQGWEFHSSSGYKDYPHHVLGTLNQLSTIDVRSREEAKLNKPFRPVNPELLTAELAREFAPQENRMAADIRPVYVKFFKDGSNLGVRTNAMDEEDFWDAAVQTLEEIINGGRFDGDWAFQFRSWLPALTDIACKMRGYKNGVIEERVLYAGSLIPLHHEDLTPFEVSQTPDNSPVA